MPSFAYTGRNSEGKVVKGIQDAQSENDAINILQSKNLLVTRIESLSASGARMKAQNSLPSASRRRVWVKGEDLLFFATQTSTLLDAGIPVLRTLEVAAEQTSSILFHNTLLDIKESIKAGSTLRDAVARHPRVFPALWPHLIEAGESSGNLPLSLMQLANHLESSLNLKKKIISALVYPAVLLTASVGAVFIFMLKIVPVFAKLFSSFKADLPVLTKSIIRLSNFFQHTFVYIILIAGTSLYFILWYFRKPQGKALLDRLIIVMPIFGGFAKETILARISINLASLIKSGVSIIKSIEITAHASGNTLYESAMIDISAEIQQGKTLATCFREKSFLFPPLFSQLVLIGEESGKLPDMVGRIAKYYETRVEIFVARLSVLIEPIVLVLVGGIVGVIVVAMFLPIFQISSIVK